MKLLAGATDERLVELARAGHEQAFAAIVERYRGPLLQYCRGFLPGAAAEDALQQTFINAYAALSRADARAPVALRPWLYRVAHNAALNVARDPQTGLAELPEGLDGVRRPDEVVAARERFRRVVGAVSALPPKQRQVIVRHAFEGESHERIARDLGMTAGSIRQLAHRARRTVREAAAGVIPAPLLRLLPFGADAADAVPAAGGGAALAKVAVAVVVAGAAGGGAVEVSTRADKPAEAASHVRPAPVRMPAARPVSDPSAGGVLGSSGSGSSEFSGSSQSGSGSGSDSSGSGGGESDSSGSGDGGRGSSGSGGGGSGSSGSDGESGSPGSGGGRSGSSGSDGESRSSGSGSGESDSSGSRGGRSGSSGSGSGDSGSSGSGGGDSGSSGSAGGDSDSSGSGSGDSGSSGSGKGSSGSPAPADPERPGGHGSDH